MFAHRTLIHFPSSEDVAEVSTAIQLQYCPYANAQGVPNILLHLRYTVLKPRVIKICFSRIHPMKLVTYSL